MSDIRTGEGIEYVLRYRLCGDIYRNGESDRRTRVLAAKTDAEALTEVEEFVGRPWADGTRCEVERISCKRTTYTTEHSELEFPSSQVSQEVES